MMAVGLGFPEQHPGFRPCPGQGVDRRRGAPRWGRDCRPARLGHLASSWESAWTRTRTRTCLSLQWLEGPFPLMTMPLSHLRKLYHFLSIS